MGDVNWYYTVFVGSPLVRAGAGLVNPEYTESCDPELAKSLRGRPGINEISKSVVNAAHFRPIHAGTHDHQTGAPQAYTICLEHGRAGQFQHISPHAVKHNDKAMNASAEVRPPCGQRIL